MPHARGKGTDLGLLVAKAKALYDLYGVVVYAAIWFDGEIKKRRAKRREKRAKR